MSRSQVPSMYSERVSFPFVVSRYLRPFLEGAELFIDNGMTSRKERLTAMEREIVRALWDRDSAAEEMATLVAVREERSLLEALESLVSRGMVFPDEATEDHLFDQLLEGSCPPVPFVDQIELTNHCPMRCSFCPRGIPGRIKRPKGYMELDLFRRILRQLHPSQASYRFLELHHLGESLLHPQVVRFVEEASKAGLPTEMSVNPSLLEPKLARGLLSAGIRRLVVSLDGLDEEMLTGLRGPAARYRQAESNLERLLELVADMGDPPRVVIQMIGLQRNRHQHGAFLERWGRTKLPSVTAYIKDLDGNDPDTGRPSAVPLTHLCSFPWRSVVVLWDGRVVPCCRDADAEVVLGDLNRQELSEIWQGPEVLMLRHLHRSQTFPEGHSCRGCGWLRSTFATTMDRRHPDLAKTDPLSW
jgi:radical SAM protein with 4Fe4S-binding SPASM domain